MAPENTTKDEQISNELKLNICQKAIRALKNEYPIVRCTLDYELPYQLLIAARLAAQCTDKRVNIVTKTLFCKYPSVQSFAVANYDELKSIVKPCGFYKVKAKDIIAMCKILTEKYNSVLPNSIDELLKLPGVGRKTANLIIGDIYKKPAVVVDTHCARITKRLGLHNSKNPVVIENVLRGLLPPKESNDFCHRLVEHGRKVCKAIKPKCNVCIMNNFCKECVDDRSSAKSIFADERI